MFVTIPSYVEGLKFDQIEGGGGGLERGWLERRFEQEEVF